MALDLSAKFDRIVLRAEELSSDLSSGLAGEAFSRASRELSELDPVVARIGEWRSAEAEAREAEQMLADPEMREMAEQELRELRDRIPKLAREIQLALLPRDEADERSAILEIRPAAGGDEAGLFAAELFAAYQKYAALRSWRFELMDYNETELGGLKEGIAEITGRNVFARLKYESGVHRVQRVPTTETQGRIHTSTVTVAVLPGGRGGGRSGQRERFADRRLSRVRRRRPARQQDGKCRADHPHPDGDRGGDAGGAQPAQEPRESDEDTALAHVRGAAGGAALDAVGGPQKARSAPATAASGYAPTIFRRDACPTTAST